MVETSYNNYIRFNFSGLNFRGSRVFAFLFLQITDFCVGSFLTTSATEEEKPSQNWDILPFGDQNEVVKLPIDIRTRRNDLVTAHIWPYKHFLSSAWHQSFIVCTGISSCISTVLIRQIYHVNVAIFAICEVTANQLVYIFVG